MHRHDPGVHTEGLTIRWARFYDLVVQVFFLGRERRFRQEILAAAQLRPGQRVLDVGCGTGTLALLAARAVGPEGQVRGVDPAVEMVTRAQGKAAKAGVAASFECAAIESLPVPDASVDVAFSTLVFHHLTPGLWDPGLAEVHRVLAPGGRLIVVDFGSSGRLEAAVKHAGFSAVSSRRMTRRMLHLLVAEKSA